MADGGKGVGDERRILNLGFATEHTKGASALKRAAPGPNAQVLCNETLDLKLRTLQQVFADGDVTGVVVTLGGKTSEVSQHPNMKPFVEKCCQAGHVHATITRVVVLIWTRDHSYGHVIICRLGRRC